MTLQAKIRFKGFTKDWEQRKLGELGSLKNGMTFSTDVYKRQGLLRIGKSVSFLNW